MYFKAILNSLKYMLNQGDTSSGNCFLGLFPILFPDTSYLLSSSSRISFYATALEDKNIHKYIDLPKNKNTEN